MSTQTFDPAQHPRGLAGRFTEKTAADPGDILTGRTLEPWQLDGPVVTATVDELDPAVVNLAVERRPGPDECSECGDRRGWRVEPDPATGDAMQVQCRTCAERADTHTAGTRFIPATEPMGQHWHVATCSCGWEGARFDSQKNAKRAADVHAQLAPARS